MSQIQGLPPLPHCFDGLIQVQRTLSENSQGDVREGISHCLNVPDQQNGEVEKGSLQDLTDEEESAVAPESSPDSTDTPFAKLNNALLRLRNEMV